MNTVHVRGGVCNINKCATNNNIYNIMFSLYLPQNNAEGFLTFIYPIFKFRFSFLSFNKPSCSVVQICSLKNILKVEVINLLLVTRF